jgi:putative endonuclease
MKKYFIYILTNYHRKVFYIGLTNNLSRRLTEHQSGIIKGFTQKYNVKYLVYFEEYTNIYDAKERERRLKKWKREWKINLIKSMNGNMDNLSDDLI